MGAVTRHKCPVMLLLMLVLQLCHSVLAGLVSSVSLSPDYINQLPDDQLQHVNVSFTLSFDGDQPHDEDDFSSYQIKCDVFDSTVAEAHGAAIVDCFKNESSSQYDVPPAANYPAPAFKCSAQVGVRGKFIGKTRMHCWVIRSEEDVFDAASLQLNASHRLAVAQITPVGGYQVWVVQSSHVLNTVFVCTLIVLCMIANCMMGCDLNLAIIKNTLAKPQAPCIGFVCQFVLMPLVSYTLARMILFPAGAYTLGLGLFTTGCSPGGGASNFWTLLMNGNTDLSITMTFLSTVLALVVMPLWMLFLGSHFLVDHPDVQIRVPYGNICSALVGLALPLLLGILIRKYKAEWADKARKVLRPFVIFVLVFIITFGSYANFYMFYLMSGRVLLAGLLLPWCGFMFGCFVSLLMRQDPRDVSAIAIETGIQNTGVAIMLLKVSFGQPDADLASVLPVVCSIFTPVPLLTAWAIHKWAEKVYGKKQPLGPEAAALPSKEEEMAEEMEALQQQKVGSPMLANGHVEAV